MRDLLRKDAELIEAITQRWGQDCKSELGEIDRKAVSRIVFNASEELRWLEKQVHPKVQKVWESKIVEHPRGNILIEIPLLFEKSLESEFDFTVCIQCPSVTVESRMQARGYTREELARRRSHQMPIEEKIERADFVVTNAGNLKFLKQQIERLIAKFRT